MDLLKLFFSPRGRIRRSDFVCALIVLCSTLVVLDVGYQRAVSAEAPLLFVLALMWSAAVLATKRARDLGRSPFWFAWCLVPIAGPAYVLSTLFFRKPKTIAPTEEPTSQHKYLTVDQDTGSSRLVINDVTRLNPVRVNRVEQPRTTDEIQNILQNTSGPVSIGGGRFSMGGQIASPDSVHFDMRSFNQILELAPDEKRIRVQSGARWCDLQAALDPHDLAIEIMQTYANFTVGGSLSVNGHGRYVGAGPLISSVLAIQVVLANGTVVYATPDENSDIFYGAIGGYGALGIVTEVTLRVTDNCRVEANDVTMALAEFPEYFASNVRGEDDAIFHNADIFPPHYSRVRATTWWRTDKPVTQPHRLMKPTKSFPLEKYCYWAISETRTGKWRRENIYEPLRFAKPQIHWRNYEAGYDVAELEPTRRNRKTYVLQEYFVPIREFERFTKRITEILQRHNVNAVNISIRHATADPGSLLAWAREEVFAFVLYYKQGVSDHDQNAVAVWTRELIDAAIECDGTYYLPYQPHATAEQFHKSYPQARELFALKSQLDPTFRFRNSLWNKYYLSERETSDDNSTRNRIRVPHGVRQYSGQ